MHWPSHITLSCTCIGHHASHSLAHALGITHHTPQVAQLTWASMDVSLSTQLTWAGGELVYSTHLGFNGGEICLLTSPGLQWRFVYSPHLGFGGGELVYSTHLDFNGGGGHPRANQAASPSPALQPRRWSHKVTSVRGWGSSDL
jgi:hypothetical protein